MIGESDAVRRQAERRAAVDEAGGETAEAAVAERRLVLEFLELRKVLPRRGQLVPDRIIESQIDQVVAQKLPDQELRRDVVELLLSLVIALCLRRVCHKVKQRVEKLQIRAVLKGLACVISQTFRCHKMVLLSTAGPRRAVFVPYRSPALHHVLFFS